MQDVLLQYGVLGVVVSGLSWFILYLIKEHKRERGEWLEKLDQIIDHNREDRRETVDVIRENTGILSGLKTLFEIHIKSK